MEADDLTSEEEQPQERKGGTTRFFVSPIAVIVNAVVVKATPAILPESVLLNVDATGAQTDT